MNVGSTNDACTPCEAKPGQWVVCVTSCQGLQSNRINWHHQKSPNNMAMHAKPDLLVEFVHSDHFFRLGDLGRYSSLSNPLQQIENQLLFRRLIRTPQIAPTAMREHQQNGCPYPSTCTRHLR